MPDSGRSWLASYVALVGARTLDDYHALEAEQGSLVLLDAAETALQEVLGDDVLSSADLDRLLSSISPVQP